MNRTQEALERLVDLGEGLLRAMRERELDAADRADLLYGAPAGTARAANVEAIRRPLRRLSFPRMMAAYALAGGNTIPDGELTPIPEAAWTQNHVAGQTVAEVACPCGETPIVPVTLAAKCECGRYFYFGGESVLVMLSPVRGAPEAEPVPVEEAPSLAELEPPAGS